MGKFFNDTILNKEGRLPGRMETLRRSYVDTQNSETPKEESIIHANGTIKEEPIIINTPVQDGTGRTRRTNKSNSRKARRN